MSAREDAYARHQQARWMRPDAYRWVRPDAARFLKPGTDPATVYPALERKYSPNQPRVPAGNPDGGQWMRGGGGDGGSVLSSRPMGNVDFGDLPSFSDLFALFQITPREQDNSDYTQLAGDRPPGIGHNEGPPLEPPEIPDSRPTVPDERMSVVWDVVEWIGKKGRYSPAVSGYFGLLNTAHWFKYYEEMTKTYYDPPRSLEQLQLNAKNPKEAGYHDHHIEEQTLLERLGFSRAERNRPDNMARIPILRHYDISGWYGTKNPDFNDLTPRQYLSDKDAATRREVGLYALRLHGLLKP